MGIKEKIKIHKFIKKFQISRFSGNQN